jgi:hypothetical protein
MIRLFLVAHGPLTEGNVTTFVRVLLETCSFHASMYILTTYIQRVACLNIVLI